MTKRHKTTITKKLLGQVEELAEQGFNNIQISQSLNIATTTLSTNKELKKSIHRGKEKLAKKVTSSILDTLEKNPTNQQMLVKRLCLFSPVVEIKKLKSAEEALENLSKATKQYADGLINESQLRTIEAVSNSYVKGYEAIELEKRISELERVNDEKK
ncbi:MAG: Unknown protein [uncultured Sulfurovum sp.]|uniref:Uncharacterized protein n=1 Tax=uncultured Sulfurovum sp. TaxID=269237 RepID=A0A6S6SWH4_9BACT|nr:MAG: Unknown protein [uncultured Sulfurovum sp.]